MPVTTSDDTVTVGSWPLHAPATSEAPGRRWSRSRIVIAVLGAALVSGGLWWNRAVTADPGLEFGAAASNVSRNSGDETGVTEVSNLVGDEASVAFEPGGRFSAWMSLYNGGPRDVTIRAFPREGFNYWGVERVVVATDDSHPFPEGNKPLRPFSVPAGETRHLRVDFRMAACNPAGLQDGKSFITALPVTYKVLGFTRTVRVPFDDAAIAVETIGHCDRPIG